MYQIAHAFLQSPGNRIVGISDASCGPLEESPTEVVGIYHPDVLSVVFQKLGQRGQCGVRIDFFHQTGFVVDGLLDVLQNVLPGLLFHDDAAPGRQKGETVGYLLGDVLFRTQGQGTEFRGKIILPMGLGHKIEDGKFGLPRRKTKATAQLLQEDGQTVCGTEEEHRIHFGNIDTFVEDVYHTEVVYQSVAKVLGQLLPLRLRGVGGQALGTESVFLELTGHEIGMFLIDTEAQGTTGVFIGQVTM